MAEVTRVRVLWTGGWDSTFRVLSLVAEGARVEPHHIDLGTRGSALERRAMANIRAAVRRDQQRFPGSIEPIVEVSRASICDRPDLIRCCENLRRRAHLGRQ